MLKMAMLTLFYHVRLQPRVKSRRPLSKLPSLSVTSARQKSCALPMLAFGVVTSRSQPDVSQAQSPEDSSMTMARNISRHSLIFQGATAIALVLQEV